MAPLNRTHRRLIVRHRRLVPFTIWRWFRDYRFDSSLWCAIWSAGWDGLLRASQKYKPEIGKFSTYAVAYIWGYASKELEKHLRRPVELRCPIRHGDLLSHDCKPLPLSDIFIDYRERAPCDSASCSEIFAAAQSALRFFDPVDRYILACHLGLDGQAPGQVAADIGRHLNLTRARVGQRYRRAMVRFRKLVARFQPQEGGNVQLVIRKRPRGKSRSDR